MLIPRLPTDNLYKFMALAGLFLVGSSYVLVVMGVPYLSEASTSLLRQTKSHLAEYQRIVKGGEKLDHFGGVKLDQLGEW